MYSFVNLLETLRRSNLTTRLPFSLPKLNHILRKVVTKL